MQATLEANMVNAAETLKENINKYRETYSDDTKAQGLVMSIHTEESPLDLVNAAETLKENINKYRETYSDDTKAQGLVMSIHTEESPLELAL